MGLFDKMFNQTPSTPEGFKPLNEKEAFIGILYASLASDGEVSEIESDRLSQLLVFKEMFSNFDIVIPYRRVAIVCVKLGSKKIIDECAPLISVENKEMLFAVVMDLMLVDGLLEEEEKDMAEYISAALSLEENRARMIIEVILIKNKGNLIIV